MEENHCFFSSPSKCLECTGNGKEDGVHVCYAMGLAWEDQYALFWGIGSSLKQNLFDECFRVRGRELQSLNLRN